MYFPRTFNSFAVCYVVAHVFYIYISNLVRERFVIHHRFSKLVLLINQIDNQMYDGTKAKGCDGLDSGIHMTRRVE
jgi:hypothetical protein